MRLQITPSSCHTIGKPDRMTQAIDRARVSFIVRSKFRKSTKRRFLGYMWLILDPFIISMIYLFVFSVVKSNPNAAHRRHDVQSFSVLTAKGHGLYKGT